MLNWQGIRPVLLLLRVFDACMRALALSGCRTLDSRTVQDQP